MPYWSKDLLLTNIISHLFQRSRSWCYIQMPVSHKDVQKPWRPIFRCPETRKNCDWRYVFSFFCGKFYTILNVLVGYVSSKTNIIIFLVHLRRMGDVSYFGILLSNPRQCLVYRPDRMLVKERKLSSHLNTMFCKICFQWNSSTMMFIFLQKPWRSMPRCSATRNNEDDMQQLEGN